MDSILVSIKKMLGIDEEITSFDPELILHINTVFGILNQIGVGVPFSITSANETWSDYLSDMSKLEMIKTYIYMKVRLIFDPPSGSVVTIFENSIKELESRISMLVD